MNIKVYTAITDGKDKHRTDIHACYTAYDRFKNPCLNAKIYKILPHLFFNDCEWSVWVDGNVFLNVDPRELVNEIKENRKDIGVFRHTERDCLYKEADVCIKWKLDDEHIIKRQTERYRDYCYPECNGLYMCFLIIRRNTEYIRRKCEQWWGEITAGSVRDQISFPFVFCNSEYVHVLSGGAVHGKCKYYTRIAHAK